VAFATLQPASKKNPIGRFRVMASAVWATNAVAFSMDAEVTPDVQDYQGTTNQPSPDQSGWIFSIAPQR
jgi:hypothetical protein